MNMAISKKKVMHSVNNCFFGKNLLPKMMKMLSAGISIVKQTNIVRKTKSKHVRPSGVSQ